jgi:hypothetical protein
MAARLNGQPRFLWLEDNEFIDDAKNRGLYDRGDYNFHWEIKNLGVPIESILETLNSGMYQGVYISSLKKNGIEALRYAHKAGLPAVVFVPEDQVKWAENENIQAHFVTRSNEGRGANAQDIIRTLAEAAGAYNLHGIVLKSGR